MKSILLWGYTDQVAMANIPVTHVCIQGNFIYNILFKDGFYTQSCCDLVHNAYENQNHQESAINHDQKLVNKFTSI